MSQAAPRVWFLNRFAYPDFSATSVLLSDLASALAQQFRVTVVAGDAAYRDGDGAAAPLPMLPYRIARVPVPARAGRLGQYRAYLAGARAALRQGMRPGDVVVALTDPPLLGALVAGLVHRKGGRLIQWWQDVFPDIATAYYLPRPVGNLVNRMTAIGLQYSLRHARHVVISAQMRDRIAQRLNTDAIRIIENWVPSDRADPLDADPAPLRRALDLGEALVLMYSGNLGRVHDTEAVISLARAVSATPGIVLLVQGAGAGMDRLKAVVNSEQLARVQIRGYVPSQDLPSWLRLADLHVVSLRRHMDGLSYPSKLYPVLQAGRPVLCLGDPHGELAGRVRDQRIGWVAESPRAFVAALAAGRPSRDALDAAGHRSRVLFEQLDLYRSAVEAWADCIEQARQGESCGR